MSRLLPIALLLLLITGACRSGKNATDRLNRYMPAQTDNAQSYGRSVEWSDITLPVNVNISRPTSLRVGGTMTMVNGRDILISLRMFGFEVGAAYVTSDSIYAYLKMQKVYIAESTSGMLGGLNLSVADIQSLLIGAPVTIPPAVSGTDIVTSVSPATGQPLTISIS
ncbi:MAG: DUF4292 domain-containing protein, partial [Duncaniella sp.]|nr:DUF4292 domain-containing protein [Duncaniella sp.]